MDQDLEGIRLTENDLRGWDFRGQNLRYAQFDQSDLSFADFSLSDLRTTSRFSPHVSTEMRNAIRPDGGKQRLGIAVGRHTGRP